jgi:hypothetical protein
MPPTMNDMRSARPSNGGRSSSARSTVTAMTNTFATVPMPGRCRSGIHSANTNSAVIAVMVPKLSGMCLCSPSCSTSHGVSPRCARTSIAMLAPKRHSPTSS